MQCTNPLTIGQSVVENIELVGDIEFNPSDMVFPKSDFYFKSGINSLRDNIIAPEFMIMSSNQIDELIVEDIVDITVSSNYLSQYCNYDKMISANSGYHALSI